MSTANKRSACMWRRVPKLTQDLSTDKTLKGLSAQAARTCARTQGGAWLGSSVFHVLVPGLNCGAALSSCLGGCSLQGAPCNANTPSAQATKHIRIYSKVRLHHLLKYK